MLFYLKKILTGVMVPPIGLVFVALLALLLFRKKRQLSHWIATCCLVGILMLSLPLVSTLLMSSLEPDAAFLAKNINTEQAIVILGGGVNLNALEFEGPTVSTFTLQRIRYGAYLFDQTGLPVLVTGGDPFSTGVKEADVMKKALEQDFIVPVMWAETRSKDTKDNAQFSWEILKPLGKTHILLVTHGWHMARAQGVFEKAGFKVTPAPMGLSHGNGFSINRLIPSGSSLFNSYLAFREWLGRLWYVIS